MPRACVCPQSFFSLYMLSYGFQIIQTDTEPTCYTLAYPKTLYILIEVSWIVVVVLYLLHEFVKHWLVGLSVLASWALAHLGLTAASFYAGVNSNRDWIIILTVLAFLFAYDSSISGLLFFKGESMHARFVLLCVRGLQRRRRRRSRGGGHCGAKN